MTRADLIAELAVSHPHLRVSDVELLVTTIFDQITDVLAHGGRVELRGFGAFTVKQRNARIGHNPRTGEAGVSEGEGAAVLQGRQGSCATGSIAMGRSAAPDTRATRRVSCSGSGAPCNAVAHEQQTWLDGRSHVAGGQRAAVGTDAGDGEASVPELPLLVRRRSRERRAALPGLCRPRQPARVRPRAVTAVAQGRFCGTQEPRGDHDDRVGTVVRGAGAATRLRAVGGSRSSDRARRRLLAAGSR